MVKFFAFDADNSENTTVFLTCSCMGNGTKYCPLLVWAMGQTTVFCLFGQLDKVLSFACMGNGTLLSFAFGFVLGGGLQGVSQA